MEPNSRSQQSQPDRHRPSGSDSDSKSGSDAGLAFRGNIPPTQNAPDRAEWLRRGFPEPVELKQIPQRFVTQAIRHIERDHSTLGFDEAVRWQTALDYLCFKVLGYVEDRRLSDLVYFDTETKSFWLYRKE